MTTSNFVECSRLVPLDYLDSIKIRKRIQTKPVKRFFHESSQNAVVAILVTAAPPHAFKCLTVSKLDFFWLFLILSFDQHAIREQ